MEIYDDFDYLCNEPFYVPNIGTIINPTLRDIRKLTHKLFTLYVNICAISLSDYLEQCGLKEQYEQLSEEDKDKNTLFTLLLYTNSELLFGLMGFFIKDNVEFRKDNLSFHVYIEEIDDDGEISKKEVGIINSDNFDIFRNEVLKILGLKQIETKKPKYKTERARLLAEKIAKAKSQLPKATKQDENMAFDNLIKKYCTHNKVGINILNVWDMTFYQFNTMFSEYNVGRQMDFNDAMASNTFSYKESSDYNPMLWIEKINNNVN